LSRQSEWRAGWPIVLIGFLGITLATMHAYSLGVMIGPIEREMSWTRAQISSGLTIASFVGVVMAPIVGMAIDRFGPRTIAMAGSALFCAMFALVSITGTDIWSWRGLWVGLAVGQAFVTPTVWTAAISSCFTRNRGMAQALALSGTGAGIGVMPILATLFVDNLGWRQTFIAMGVSWSILLLPLIFFLLHTPADRPRPKTPDKPAASPTLPGLSAQQGFRSRAFLLLAAAAVIYAFALSGVTINMVPVLISLGLSAHVAASITGAMAIGVIIGRLGAGFLFDRVNARFVVGAGVGLSIIPAMILLFFPGSVTLSTLAVLLYGFLLGPSISGFAFLATQHFGLRAFGTLFGWVIGLLSLASGLAPMLVNHVYDVTHSYQPVLFGAIVGSLITAALFLMLGDYPDFSEPAAEAA
jgi:MFS family permease